MGAFLKGIQLLTTGLIALARAISKGFVRAALSSFVSNFIGGLVGSALALIPVSWWSSMLIAVIVVSLLWQAKGLLYNIPKGIWHIKQSIKHTH